jgi:hypothetical protein
MNSSVANGSDLSPFDYHAEGMGDMVHGHKVDIRDEQLR